MGRMVSRTDHIDTLLERGHLIIHGKTSLTTQKDAALNKWWTHEHLPERLSVPGFLTAKRYKTIDSLDGDDVESCGSGYQSYLVWYETRGIGVLSSEAYTAKLNNPTEGTKQTMPIISSLDRSACKVVSVCAPPQWTALSATGGSVEGKLLIHGCAHIRNENEPSHALLDEKLHPLLQENPNVLSITVLSHDEATTQAGNQTSSYTDVNFEEGTRDGAAEYSKWHFLIDCTSPTPKPDKEWWIKTSGQLLITLRDIGVPDLCLRLYSLIVAAHS